MLLTENSRMSGVGYTKSPQTTHDWTAKKEGERKEVLSPLWSHPGETMLRYFNAGVWIPLLLLFWRFPGFASNTSAQNLPLNASDPGDEENAEWKWLFLQLRASLTSYSQPLRPYALLTNAEDYHHLPKPKHCRPSRLLRLLGSSFDPFWMSVDNPTGSPEDNSTTKQSVLPGAAHLRETEASQRLKLEKEVANLDLGPLPSYLAKLVRERLVRSASCRLSHRWVDLGPAFWPRWLRHTDCERAEGEQSCSFPSGMQCVRAQTAHIKILAWHCLETGEGEREKSEGAEIEAGEVMTSCAWRRMPYPVVTACSCLCK